MFLCHRSTGLTIRPIFTTYNYRFAGSTDSFASNERKKTAVLSIITMPVAVAELISSHNLINIIAENILLSKKQILIDRKQVSEHLLDTNQTN